MDVNWIPKFESKIKLMCGPGLKELEKVSTLGWRLQLSVRQKRERKVLCLQWSPTGGLEPPTTGLKGQRSTDWARQAHLPNTNRNFKTLNGKHQLPMVTDFQELFKIAVLALLRWNFPHKFKVTSQREFKSQIFSIHHKRSSKIWTVEHTTGFDDFLSEWMSEGVNVLYSGFDSCVDQMI